MAERPPRAAARRGGQDASTTVSPPARAATAREPSRRWPRRPALGALAALVALAAVVLLIVDPFAGGGAPAQDVADNAFPISYGEVTRRALSSQTEVSATLGYADPATIVASGGTAPSALAQSEQSAAAAQAQLATAEGTLASDGTTLAEEQALLVAARQKLAVDCAGDNAGESAASSGASGSGAAGPCAADEQALTGEVQSAAAQAGKVAADRVQAGAATAALASARTSLAAAQSQAALSGQSSIYSELPPVGATIARGETLYEVSGQPVVLLYGAVAPWRAFSNGMSAGPDVAELNANLRALGYGRGLTGARFTSATARAIGAFQAARRLPVTGKLLLGSVVFEAGAVRVTSVTPTLGGTVQAGPVLTVTSTRRQVTIALDAAQQAEVRVGDPVEITLPDDETTPGRVTYVGTVATTPSGGGGGGGGSSSPTIEVDVTPTDPAATGHLDQTPVTVSITTASTSDALAVPVNALLALASGGYAVELAGAGGVHRLVGVELGLFDDAHGLVQVSGAGLAPGERVVVPGQ